MGHVPDHTPATAAVEHAALMAALDAGDLLGGEKDRAATLAHTCPGCASLLADLAVLRAATAALPATPRTRDYRLTDADVARLQPSVWGRLVGWLGAPRSTLRPLAGGLAALGIAGLLLSTTPGFFGQAASMLSTTGTSVMAPGEAGGAGGAADGNAPLSTGLRGLATPNAAATVGPDTTSAPDAAPGPAALPAPSPAMGALPAPSPAMGALTGPAAAATPGPADFSTDAGAMSSQTKVAAPEASQGERNVALAPASEPATPDRGLPVALSLALLGAGLWLFIANRALLHRAQA
jgi:hypothetical protein